MNGLVIRPASQADAPAMLEIYAWYIRNTAVSLAWEPPVLHDFLQTMEAVQERYPWLVAEKDGEILGYAYAHTFVPRRSYDWSAEVTIYLRSEMRRQGIGRALYSALEDVLGKMGVQNLYACIAFSESEDEYMTHASPDFHACLGYRQVGMFRRCARKFGRWYDMIWTEKVIGSHAEQASEVKPFSESMLEG